LRHAIIQAKMALSSVEPTGHPNRIWMGFEQDLNPCHSDTAAAVSKPAHILVLHNSWGVYHQFLALQSLVWGIPGIPNTTGQTQV